jgi:N-acyl-D-aspartate/D-glutamate deacylase
MVVDGTGAPGHVADVAVKDGRIVSVAGPGEVEEKASRTINATGLVVAPGFIDIHTHYDAQVFWDPMASPSPFHGVTTILGGNCGFSLAPTGPDHVDYLSRMMAKVEGMPLEALQAGLAWDWQGFGEWIDHLEGAVAVNAGFLTGHSTLRRAVMGDDSVEGSPSAAQTDAMVRMLHEALAAGSLGFSTSTAPTHLDGDGRPVPSRAASTDEILALAAALRDHPGTSLEIVLAGVLTGFSEAEIEMMADMSVMAGRPMNWNLLIMRVEDPVRHEALLAASDRVAERGGRLVALTVPRIPGRQRVNFLTGFALAALPGWQETMALEVEDRIAALRDPEVRRRLREGSRSQEAGTLARDWGQLEINETFAAENDGLAARVVGDIARARGQDPFDTLLDIVVADGLRTGVTTLPRDAKKVDEEWAMQAKVWRDPRAVIGGSDAGAHMDVMCGATYSTSLLSHGVRERNLIELEQAVRLLSDVPARYYGLKGRGRVAEGWLADLVVFDSQRVGYGALYTRDDLPGGASRLYSDGEGFESVIVNGVEIVASGKATGATPGTVIRSGRDTEPVGP